MHCFVDGFNLYHAIKALGPTANHLKWLDLWKLATAFIVPSQEQLTGVSYFTAFATWIPDAYTRHRTYIKALESSGVTTVKGRFKRKEKSCPQCNKKIPSHEEKESDVSFGIYIVHQAHIDGFDKVLIITADSDFLPVIKLVSGIFPGEGNTSSDSSRAL
uniref:Uncharacterized conserved protein, LabA/DUF88 family n=1 Tax=Candidatus Kentrum sp. FW TaxID=2126338 RepID=A0A450T682_9GAMM|nr:MAG: Uncharacterized conserved protein, LabA/DUF88 family [Candidatus Kentron sp. FW]